MASIGLLRQYGVSLLGISAIPKNARVSMGITGNRWNWPIISVTALRDIVREAHSIQIRPHVEDNVK